MKLAEPIAERRPATDEGYFPRGSSILRRVHEQRAVGLLYGQRALAIGAINPLNFIGTISHTRGRDRPFRRLVHTAKMFESIFFGSRAEADAVLATVERLHQPVHGALSGDAGPFPAGTPYSAFDPELMLWTVAVIADSAQTFYELFVGPLSDEEREALWRDYVRFGELFGMPAAVAPDSYAEFRAYWRERLEGPEAHLTDEARYVGSAIMFEIPVPAAHRPAMRVHNLIVLGSLPARVRDLYGLPWTAGRAAAFRLAVAALRAPRPLTPRRLRSGMNTAFFDLVGRTEATLVERGEPIPGALA
jgi:uncharacterized protein (DUF2236 family)